MNSPKQLDRGDLSHLYETKYAARFEGCNKELLDSATYNPPRSGFAEYRFERWSSQDGKYVLLADIYVRTDKTEKLVIVTLETDGQEYLPWYTIPLPLDDEL